MLLDERVAPHHSEHQSAVGWIAATVEIGFALPSIVSFSPSDSNQEQRR